MTQAMETAPAVRPQSWSDHLAVFEGRWVVVTGVGGGIGQAVAAAFASVGAQVVGLDRTDELATEALLGLPSAPGRAHVGLGADLTSSADVTVALTRLRAVSKDVAALVNVAGVAEDAVAHMVTQDSLRKHQAVNFNSSVQVAQYVSRLMARTGGGSIVNVSSVTSLDGNAGQLAYGASKAALNTATRILSMELAGSGVRVNAVAPGVVDTAMTRTLAAPAREALLSRVAMARMADPSEVASVILWLSSPAASFVTGQVLRVDGGM